MGVGDLAEVNVFYTLVGQRLENVFGFRGVSAGETKAALAASFHTNMVKASSGGLLYLASNQMSSDHLSVRDVLPGTSVSVELAYAAVTGSVTDSEPLPPQCAAVIKWTTGLGGRSYRGRTYLSGLTETAQSGGTVAGAFVAAYQAFVANMLAVYGPAGTDPDWQLCVISRRNGKVARAAPVGTPILAGTVRTTVYSQRRRTPGVGA